MSMREHRPNVNAVAPSEPVQVVPPPPVGTVMIGPPSTHFGGGAPVTITGTHVPAEQPLPGPHFVPHAPQLASSSPLLTHLLPHAASGAGHVPVQPFDTQYGLPAGHTLPHAPQLFGSTDVMMHWPPHSVWPNGHSHWPALHCWPAPQACPHAPQFAESLSRFAHEPPQFPVPSPQRV